jgi:hypothetical protein
MKPASPATASKSNAIKSNAIKSNSSKPSSGPKPKTAAARPRKGKNVVMTDDNVPASEVVKKVALARKDDADASVDTPMLILVYGRHCGHCIAFQDDWKHVSNALAQRTSMNTLALEASNLDGWVRSEPPARPESAYALMDHLADDVFAVPYITIWYPDGSTSKFANERTPDNIIHFVEKELQQKAGDRQLKKK